VRKPQVFLFDEPLSNLDAKLRVQMRTEIKELHQRLKTTSIYVTHDQIEAMTMADKIVVMHDGIVEQIGTRSSSTTARPTLRRRLHRLAGDELHPAEVVVVEPTGADTQIYCRIAGVDVTAVVRERHTFRPGETVRLAPQLTFLFDPASGQRLA
jgi:multiple sugar transport system ATP-binding protein